MNSAYPNDLQAVLNLLQKLSQVHEAYPLDLFMQTRVEFLDSALTVKAFLPHGSAGHGGGSLTASSAKSVLINSLLTTVLIAEIAAGAYVLRDQWLPLFINEPPAQVNTVPEAFDITDPIPPGEEAATDFPVETASPEETAVSTATPIPESTSISIPSDASSEAPANISSSPAPPSVSTSDPLSEPVEPVETEKEHPGLHLGQTPGPPTPPNPPNPPGQNKNE
jgi:hypothetical protein